jgi:hypothetical protein
MSAPMDCLLCHVSGIFSVHNAAGIYSDAPNNHSTSPANTMLTSHPSCLGNLQEIENFVANDP